VAAPLVVPPLVGARVRLEPLRGDHVDALFAAAAESRDTYNFTTVPATFDAMAEHVDDLLADQASGEAVAFVQTRVIDDRAVGMTRFLSLRRRSGDTLPFAVEIGGTWLAASAQRSGINREAKLLLLSYAFDEWRVGRVDFKTDARNERSRRALVGIGATFEGVLRNWQPSHAAGEEGLLRDSAMFSITAAEWPAVRAALVAGLTPR
jgi:RimJ/RimL family protein N-acetyltransferase